MSFDRLRGIVAAMFLVGFVGIWVWIAVKLLRFHPTNATPQLVLSTAFATVSGALSGTVGAGTAAVLGIKIQEYKPNNPTMAARVRAATKASPLLVAGILAYLIIGALLIYAWLAKDAASPDVVQSFAIGSLGWMGGAFVAVFAAQSS